MSIALTQLNTDEILRYMGCPPDQADPATRALAQSSAQQLLTAIHPQWAWRVYDVVFAPDGTRLSCGLLLPGQDLRQHLQGCSRVALFCVTLGAGADALIRQAQHLDMARALALDCAATAAVEQLCDWAERELRTHFPGCYFPFRFSPGYGDLPLSVQNSLLELLDAPRRVGLTASQRHILIPRKSVTAILGIAEHPIPKANTSCLDCPVQVECQYRKAGGHCGIS